jgi:hypothetical protein
VLLKIEGRGIMLADNNKSQLLLSKDWGKTNFYNFYLTFFTPGTFSLAKKSGFESDMTMWI